MKQKLDRAWLRYCDEIQPPFVDVSRWRARFAFEVAVRETFGTKATVQWDNDESCVVNNIIGFSI